MRKRNKHISVWMTEQEYTHLKQQAARSGFGTMAAKRTQSRSSPPMAGRSHIRKNFVYFSKNIPRGSFTIKKCFDRIKAQFIHSQSSNAKTVSRYLGEEVA